MSFLSGIGSLLQQYTGNTSDTASIEQHFDQIAANLPCSSIASGLAQALRSGQAGSFSQAASQLFANGDGNQQANMLSGLLASVGPSVIAQFTGNNPNSPLAALLQSGATSVTPEQAANVPAGDVAALAQHAHNADPSIIDRMSEIYAQHPTLIKTLGAAAMTIAVKHIASQHAA
ncbi:MAG TPA: hypothetical protein VGR96_16575 [Acidobacteriaceae bacterium]|nr:hypothetical protein [Acidobacteriaceae bacterium]